MKHLGWSGRSFHFQDFEAQPRAVGKAKGPLDAGGRRHESEPWIIPWSTCNMSHMRLRRSQVWSLWSQIFIDIRYVSRSSEDSWKLPCRWRRAGWFAGVVTWASVKTFLERHEKRARRGSGFTSEAVSGWHFGDLWTLGNDGGVVLGIVRLLISTALTLEPWRGAGHGRIEPMEQQMAIALCFLSPRHCRFLGNGELKQVAEIMGKLVETPWLGTASESITLSCQWLGWVPWLLLTLQERRGCKAVVLQAWVGKGLRCEGRNFPGIAA